MESTRFDVSMIKKKREIRDRKGIKVWNKASKERNVDLTAYGKKKPNLDTDPLLK